MSRARSFTSRAANAGATIAILLALGVPDQAAAYPVPQENKAPVDCVPDVSGAWTIGMRARRPEPMTTIAVQIEMVENDDPRMLAKLSGTARNNLGEAGTIYGYVSKVRTILYFDFDRLGSIGRGRNAKTKNPDNVDYDALFVMEHRYRVGTYEILDDGSWVKANPWDIRLGGWQRAEGPFPCDQQLTRKRN